MKVSSIVQRVKGASIFSAGVFVGVCYGSIVATITTYTLLVHGVGS